MQDIFSLGFNCHLKNKFDRTKHKVEIELLYENIKDKVRAQKVVLHNEDAMKCELERFGTKNFDDHLPNILSKDQMKKIKEFAKTPTIAIRRADKSNVFVLLDKQYYVDQLTSIISDRNKFEKVDKDPTNDLKRELAKLVAQANKSGDAIKFAKVEGMYEPGYLYGNPKIHKKLQDPPLRPIISQIGTVTYEVSKRLNDLIVPYMPNRYNIKSTYDFLQLIRSVGEPGQIASLDVESLFTNIPVSQTIEIILTNVYNHSTLPPPKISENLLREMLKICTTRTPFKHVNGDIYIQREGVSMGCCLGPTFSEFYMCHLENRVFEQYPNLKPKLYTRYVDDIFVVVDDIAKIDDVKKKFEEESVLKFTHEPEKDRKLAFLDCMVERFEQKYVTSVYVKQTNAGDCLNYHSVCPERYKTGVIKTLLHRGYLVSSTWDIFHAEVQRIKQLLTDNNFPCDMVDDHINKFISAKMTTEERGQEDGKEKVNFWFLNQMTSNYKVEEQTLTKIIQTHVLPGSPDLQVKLNIYYRAMRLSNLLIKNKVCRETDPVKQHHVVYRYTCNQAGCNSTTYVGYTTCTLQERFRTHAQNGSIISHQRETHNRSRVPRDELLKDVKVVARCNERRRLVMTEAMVIKQENPGLNSQAEGCDKLLKIFVH